MAGLKPIRRVVTGNDERGKSKVVWDGPAPNAHAASMGLARGHTDLWVWKETPPPLSGTTDDGNDSYVFPGPDDGGHLRVVQGPPKPADYDPAKDRDLVAPASAEAARGRHARLGPRRQQLLLLRVPQDPDHRLRDHAGGRALPGARRLRAADEGRRHRRAGRRLASVEIPHGRADGVRHVRGALRGRAQRAGPGQGQADHDRAQAPRGREAAAQDSDHRPGAGHRHAGVRRTGARRAHRSGAAGLRVGAALGHGCPSRGDRFRDAAPSTHR